MINVQILMLVIVYQGGDLEKYVVKIWRSGIVEVSKELA